MPRLSSGTGTTDRRFLGADERGSIISLTDSSGALLNINRYDEYGKPQSTNTGRFQYTGQKWIGEAGLYDYKARFYAPHLGIFVQTDPTGYADSPNLYVYTVNNPINLMDPFGTQAAPETVIGGAEETQTGSGRVWDWMGSMVSSQAVVMAALSDMSAGTGVSIDCLLSCSLAEVYALAAFNASPLTSPVPSIAGNLFTLAGSVQSGAALGISTGKNFIYTPASFFAHFEKFHFGYDDRFSSKFASRFQNSVSVFNLAAFAANNAQMTPGQFAGTFTYTARYSSTVGYLFGTGAPTNWVTLTVSRLGTYSLTGLPAYNATSLYPGFPKPRW